MRRSRRLPPAALAALAVLCLPLPAPGQTLPEDFLNPILTMNAEGHTDLIHALAFSPDGRRLITGGRDKAVHVWTLDDGRLLREETLRPPMRRIVGRTFAIAVSPREDAEHRRLAAVAGAGALGASGGILLYRIPGPPGRSGDLAMEIPTGTPGESPGRGHVKAVFGLAFSRNGLLASCGEDRTTRIWDVDGKEPRQLAVLAGHDGIVRKASFLDEARVVSVGGAGDGSIRIWDWRANRELLRAAPPRESLAGEGAKALAINALAVSPGGRYVLIGRENGSLERYSGTDLSGGVVLNPAETNDRRPIEALAVSPDGSRLAVSVLKNRATVADFPSKECNVELRSLPDGTPLETVRTANGLVMAVGFSPDGRFLAMGGGERQEVAVRDFQNPTRDLQADGPGTILWDVAFLDEKPPIIAFRRSRAVEGRQPAWEAFDLAERRYRDVPPGTVLQTGLGTTEGWTFRPLAFDRVELVPPQGEPIPVALGPLEGRWSSFTFIPSNPQAGHAAPCAAIGTEEGTILVYNLRDRTRSRLLLGHGGSVHALAPSADGRWLASSSADMTVSLWNLDGCDARPPLGADLGRNPQGAVVAMAVPPHTAASRLGLKAGDVIVGASQARTRTPIDVSRLNEVLAGMAPDLNDQVTIEYVRAGVPERLGQPTNRADLPALKFFASPDREWIVWMPEGYYETSIAGDRRLLGWHVNHIDVANPNDFRSLPSDFHPMSRYEAQLRRPALIDEVLRTNDPVRVLAALQTPLVVRPPPVIRMLPPAGAAPGDAPAVAQGAGLVFEAQASPDRLVRSIIVHEGLKKHPERIIDPPAAVARATESIPLNSERTAVTVEAVDDQGVRSVQDFSIRLAAASDPPATPPLRREPRLVIRSIGVEKLDRRDLPAIARARDDAADLAAFFQEPDGREHFSRDSIDAKTLADPKAAQVDGVFKELADDARAGRLKAGDTVVVVIESHLFKPGDAALVAGADAQPPGTAWLGASAAGIAENLEEIASQGCLTILLVDALHYGASPAARGAFPEWVRDVSRRGVVVLSATKQETSERLVDHGAFAASVLGSTSINGGGGRSDAPTTLYDFKEQVIRLVGENTGRRQFAGFYPPETFSGWTKVRIFDPQPTSAGNLVRR